MKYIAEYHFGRGGFISREFETKEAMDKIAMSFHGSRKGVHQWKLANGAQAIVPLEHVVMFTSAEVEEKVEEESGEFDND